MRPLDRRVMPYLAPARRPLTVLLAVNVTAGVLVVVQAITVASLLSALLADPMGPGWHAPAWWLLGVTVARATTGWLGDVAGTRAAGVVGRRLRALVVSEVVHRPATDLAHRRTGELSALATRGVAAVEPYLTRYLPTLVLAGVLPVLAVAGIAVLDPWSALIVVLTLPLVPVFAVLIGMSTREEADREWRTMGDLAGHFLDVVRGLPTLVAHDRATAQVDVVRTVTHRHRRASLRTLRLAFASSGVLELVATISVALVAVVVGLRLADGGMDLRTALAVLLLAPEAYWPLRRVGAEFHAAAEGTATFAAIHTLLAERANDQGSPTGPVPGLGRRATPGPALHLQNLDIAWPDRAPVVRGLTATIPASGLTAITGASGSGKSTLVQVLLGELAPASGTIRYGDRPLAADLAGWQRRVAQVPQRPWLTAGTVAENLRLGRPGADTAALWRALAEAALADVVDALPHGLDTPLGDDGAGLSAGQRARLALARVLLADRPWVVLDEPTAHLDTATEQVLLDCLVRLARTRAVIVVAHRQALVATADHVIDLTSPQRQQRRHPVVLTGAPARAPVPAGAVSRVVRPGDGDADPAPRPVGRRQALAVLLAVLASGSGIALTATAGWLIARAAEQPPVLMLTLAIVGVRAFGLARPVFRYAERLVSHDVALQLLAERRASTYAALVPLAPGRTGRRGDVLAAVVDDVDALVDHRLRVQMPVLTWLGVTVPVLAAGALTLPASVPVLVLVLLTGATVLTLAHRSTAAAETAYVEARGQVGLRVHDVLADARQLVLWQAAEPALARLENAARRLGAAATRAAAGTATARALAVLASGIGVVGIAVTAAPAMSTGALSGPMLALLLLLPLALVDVLSPLADAGALRARTRAAERRLEDLTRQSPTRAEPPDPEQAPVAGRTDVRLKRMAAGWGQRPAFTCLDLDIPAGRWIGVTGPSGSGKSTLAAVLAGHLSPSGGTLVLDGVDSARWAGRDLHARVGLVDDDPYLFGSTLAENVRLALPCADDAAVEAALRAAHLGPLLDRLPEGLGTRIGDGGAALSGGERARLGLARAVLADRPVLVLDEPTAHLDGPTARAVATDLLDAAVGRTLIWITHDRVALHRMDEVLELDAHTRQFVGKAC